MAARGAKVSDLVHLYPLFETNGSVLWLILYGSAFKNNNNNNNNNIDSY